jgi:hypothetical protein
MSFDKVTAISAAVVAAATGGVVARDSVARTLQDVASRRERVISGRRALGLIGAGDVAYRHDSVHALYSDQLKPHPDNLAALSALCASDVGAALARSQFHTDTDVQTSIDTNLFLIGAPIAEGLTQPLFGYSPEADVADSLVLNNAPVELPYRLVMSRSEVEPAAIARRFVAGKGLVERPNWRIEGQDRFVPMTDSERYLVDDYMLVTRLPNYASTDALDSGHFLVSIAGAHGTGTRAVALLLKNKRLLAEIGSLLEKQASAFQMVFRVSKLKHTPRYGTVGSRIELAGGPVTIDSSEDRWREARRIAGRNLDAWWARQAG